MSDEVVERRLRNDKTWPNHCGRIMMLRHVLVPKKERPCSDASCLGANFGTCGCSCRGRYHGVNNPNPHFSEVKIKPLEWYEKPISHLINV